MHLLVQPPLVHLLSLPTPFFPPPGRVLALLFWVQPSPAHAPTLPASLGLLFRLGCCPKPSLFHLYSRCYLWCSQVLPCPRLQAEETGGDMGRGLILLNSRRTYIPPGRVLGRNQSKAGVREETEGLGAARLSPSGVPRGSGATCPRFAGGHICTHLALAGPSNPGCLCPYIPACLGAHVQAPQVSALAGLASPQSPFHSLPPQFWAPLTPQGDLSCCCYF